MSRAPKVESAYTPLHASIGPAGVIDFVDNSLQTLAPGVMGGPPAYLEAHGIRYVPAVRQDDDHERTPVPPDGDHERAAGAPRDGLESRIQAFVQNPTGLARERDFPDRVRPPVSARRYAERPPVSTRRYSAYSPSDPVEQGGLNRAWSSAAEAAKTERLLGQLQSRMPAIGRATVASRLAGLDY